jgi:hypothetical protein
MASKQELEKLSIVRLAALCENVAGSSAIDKKTAALAAMLKLEWVKLVVRETPPPTDFKTYEQIQKEKAALKSRMVELLVTI